MNNSNQPSANKENIDVDIFINESSVDELVEHIINYIINVSPQEAVQSMIKSGHLEKPKSWFKQQ